jgi:hypothetical protein
MLFGLSRLFLVLAEEVAGIRQKKVVFMDIDSETKCIY